MSTTTRQIVSSQDVESIRELIEEHAAELWDVDSDTGRVDWDDWCLRFERTYDMDLPGDYADPAMRKLQSIARTAIREARL